jgi:UV DNA damage endonuclease
MSSDLAPYVTHPDMPQFHGMIKESIAELGAVGAKARELGIRLSFHPSQFVVLNSPDPKLVDKRLTDLSTQAEMLDLMEHGPEAIVVIHVGGMYGDRDASLRRWAETWQQLPLHVQRRLVLEHDDLRFSAADILRLHEQTGVRLIFDYQHFWCLNPERLDMLDALQAILKTWPEGVRPKIHFSSRAPSCARSHEKTAGPVAGRKSMPRRSGRDMRTSATPLNLRHSCAWHLASISTSCSKPRRALISLRPDMLRFAADVAARFGFGAAQAECLEQAETMPPIEDHPEAHP